jgi:hypothetical protein
MSDIKITIGLDVILPVNIVALIDDTDFKTIEDSVAYNAAGMDLSWNFVTKSGVYTKTPVTPTSSGAHDWINKGDGFYGIEMPAASATISNDEEGCGWFSGKMDGVLAFRGPSIEFAYLPAGKQNTPLANFLFTMTETGTNVLATDADVTVTRKIDNGSFAAGDLSAVTEVGGGAYVVDFAATDRAGKVVTLKATADDCNDRIITFVLDP